MPPMYLTPAEAARETGFCKATIYNLMQKGLPYHKVANRRRIPVDGLKAFMAGEIEQQAHH